MGSREWVIPTAHSLPPATRYFSQRICHLNFPLNRILFPLPIPHSRLPYFSFELVTESRLMVTGAAKPPARICALPTLTFVSLLLKAISDWPAPIAVNSIMTKRPLDAVGIF